MEDMHSNGNGNALRAWCKETHYENYYKPIQLETVEHNKVSPSSKQKKPQDNVTTSKCILPFHSARLNQKYFAVHCGGPVWAIDWLPINVPRTLMNVQHGSWQYLAVSTHPPCSVNEEGVVGEKPPDHYYNVEKGSRGLIQIWAVPTDPKNVTLLPKFVYAIDHNAGAVWDLKWWKGFHELKHCKDRKYFVLAACFGNGTIQLFHVSIDALFNCEGPTLIETLEPIVMGNLTHIVPFCLEWSPHSPYQLLTGCSDGSIVLWDLEAIYGPKGQKQSLSFMVQILPRRRFHDADAVSKTETCGWGPGWVAVRSVAWSPHEKYLFASIGNDSNLKIWDLREHRIPLQRHVIRPTWGIRLLWIESRAIHYSGDQNIIYRCDVITGEFQTISQHSQHDSPVWDIQYLTHSKSQVIVSCCASGTIRIANAKKSRRIGITAAELCRITEGDSGSSVNDSANDSCKSSRRLCVYLEPIIRDDQDSSAPNEQRHFPPRYLALHKLRLNRTQCPTKADGTPILLAAAGHAGLLLLSDIQRNLETALSLLKLQKKRMKVTPEKTSIKQPSKAGMRKKNLDSDLGPDNVLHHAEEPAEDRALQVPDKCSTLKRESKMEPSKQATAEPITESMEVISSPMQSDEEDFDEMTTAVI